MSPPEPIRSVTQRLWSWALSALGLAVVATVTWSLLQPLLPVLLMVALGTGAVAVVRARRTW